MLGPAAGRFVRELCLSVVPAIFFLAGTFSFTRSFRPPSSGHGFVAGAESSSAPPAPSTKGRMVAFGRGRDVLAGALASGAVDRLEEDAASAVRREGPAAGAGAGVSGGGAMAAQRMRFWNSWCRLLRWSRGSA